SLFTFTGNYATNIILAGRLVGNYTEDPAVIVPGYPVATYANFFVRGWSANIGHDWSQVEAAIQQGSAPSPFWYGESQVAQDVYLGGGAVPVPILFSASGFSDGFPGFTLEEVPEPNTLVLLGGMIVFLFSLRSTKN